MKHDSDVGHDSLENPIFFVKSIENRSIRFIEDIMRVIWPITFCGFFHK
jgi:hypothetical protein